MGTPATGPHVLRRINRTAVLDAVRAAGAPVRVAELIHVTGLSRPAVTRALADLTDAGLVTRHDAPGEQNVGRPAQRVAFRRDAGFVAGLDIDPRRIRIRLTDLAGDVRVPLDLPAPPTGAAIVAAAAEGVGECLDRAGLTGDDLWAIGVATPGVVDAAGAIRLAPSIPGWAGLEVNRTLGDRWACPVVVDNDVTLAAVAEHARGAARETRTFVYVHWDERVGTGIVIDGRPYRGAASAAGELGFLELGAPAGSPQDGMGAFERLTGSGTIRALAEADPELRELLRDVPPDRVAATALAVAATLRDTVTARFAVGLAALILLLDPEAVVLGGSVAEAGQPLLDDLTAHLRPRLLVPPRLVRSELGDQAPVRGAVLRALESAETRLSALASV